MRLFLLTTSLSVEALLCTITLAPTCGLNGRAVNSKAQVPTGTSIRWSVLNGLVLPSGCLSIVKFKVRLTNLNFIHWVFLFAWGTTIQKVDSLIGTYIHGILVSDEYLLRSVRYIDR